MIINTNSKLVLRRRGDSAVEFYNAANRLYTLRSANEFTVKWFPSDKKLKEKLKDNPITFTYKVGKE